MNKIDTLHPPPLQYQTVQRRKSEHRAPTQSVASHSTHRSRLSFFPLALGLWPFLGQLELVLCLLSNSNSNSNSCSTRSFTLRAIRPETETETESESESEKNQNPKTKSKTKRPKINYKSTHLSFVYPSVFSRLSPMLQLTT